MSIRLLGALDTQHDPLAATITIADAATPEPATFLLIGTGLLLMWYTRMGRLQNASGETSQAETDLVFFIDTTNEAIRTQRELDS